MAPRPRVLMVIPNQRWAFPNTYWSIHPYAVCTLIAMIRDFCQVGFLDANVDDMSLEEFRRRVSDFGPEIMGVSVLSGSYRDAGYRACQVAKELNPQTVTVMGGVFVTADPRRAMLCPQVDYGVIGEGEYVFPELIHYITGRNPEPPAEGVVLRTGRDLEVRPQRHYIEDLDALPFPDYSLLDFRKYSTEFKHTVDAPRRIPYGKIITSRGCPIGCVFCEVEHIAGKRTRSKSPGRVIEEIQFMIDHFGIKSVEFLDDQLLHPRRRFKEILRRMIEKDWDLVWNAQNVSVFYLDEEMLELMAASKCAYVSMAVESGSPRVLKEIINKPVDIEHAKKMAAYARKLGMDTCSLYVIGFPGETWDEIRQTIRLAEEIGTDYVKINVAAPFPGTRLFDLARQTGALPPDLDLDRIEWGVSRLNTDQFTADQLNILRAMEWDRINFATREKQEKLARMMSLSLAELQEIRRQTIDLRLCEN